MYSFLPKLGHIHLIASKCLWMGTLTGRLVASKKSVKRFLSIILVWATLTCLQLTYLGSLTFSPQAGTKKERRSRLSRSSTLPLGKQNLCWLFCPFFTTLGWFSKTAQVEIVHLANLGVGMNMIPSSQHAATCSLCVMRNWTGRLDYLPSLPALIPHGIPRSAFPMYCSLLWVAPPPVLLGPSISPWLCPLTWGRKSLLIFLELPQSTVLQVGKLIGLWALIAWEIKTKFSKSFTWESIQMYTSEYMYV